ncbi:unnamed protein product [Arabidopsis halleri]
MPPFDASMEKKSSLVKIEKDGLFFEKSSLVLIGNILVLLVLISVTHVASKLNTHQPSLFTNDIITMLTE